MNDISFVDITRNNQALEETLTSICHELELALKWKRPSFLFVIFDNELSRHFAQDALEALLQQADQKVIHYEVESQKQIELIDFIKEISGNNKDVFYIEASNSAENNSQSVNLISIMNTCRGFLVDNMVRVVFWLTDSEASKVAHLAPDFWASRHRVFEFCNIPHAHYESSNQCTQVVGENMTERFSDVFMPLDDADMQVESPLVIDFSEDDEPTFSGINVLLMLGVANWKEGNQEKALEPLLTALALAEKSGNKAHQVMCHKAIALVHSEAGRTEEAIRAYQHVIKIGPGNVTIWNNLGLLYLKAAKLDEAKNAFTTALNVNANDPISWCGLGNIHSGYGRMEEAINCFRKAIQCNAGYVAPWIQLADILVKQARLDDALYAYMRIVEMDKKNVRAWSEIGSIYFKAGSFEQSIDAYKKALLLGDTSPKIHKNLAYAHTQAGNFSEATPLLLKAIDLERDPAEKAALFNILGDVYRRVGDYDNAVVAYEKADGHTEPPSLQVLSSPLQPVEQPGVALEVQSSMESPVKTPPVMNRIVPSVGQEIHINPGIQAQVVGLQRMEGLGNRNITPVVNGVEAVQPDPKNADLLVRLGKMYVKMGAVEKALEAFEKSVILDPANGKTYFELGLLYSQKNELTSAISSFKISADLLPEAQDKANALTLVGNLYRNLKDYANALDAYEAAFGFDPENDTVMDHLEKIQIDLDQLIKPVSAMKNAQTQDGSSTVGNISKKAVTANVNSKAAIANDTVEDQPIKIDLTNPDVWNELGNIYARSNAYGEAVEAYQKAIALNPEFGWSYCNLAMVYAFQGRTDEAVTLLKKSIDLLWTEKDKSVAWNRIGDILRQAGQYPGAIEAYQNADRLNQAQVSVNNVHDVSFEHLFSHFVS